MTYRTAQIILPVWDNEAKSLADAHKILVKELLDAFGGFTRTDGIGWWKSDVDGHTYNETVYVYTIAMDEHGSFGSAVLRRIGREMCTIANQQAVYVQLPDGKVEFLTAAREV